MYVLVETKVIKLVTQEAKGNNMEGIFILVGYSIALLIGDIIADYLTDERYRF